MSTEAVARTVERYEILDQIGHGGMAEVYRARDRRLDRLVALKILSGGTPSESDRARFLAEGRILAGLSHPGLITLLDVGVDGEQPFLVMELIEGTTLAGPRQLSEVAIIGRQLAEALAYAHASGVVHRDVKPENVLVGLDGRARLTDFGIARLLGDAVQHTAAGKTIGTPAYLAPEQVRGDPVDTAADVYSLGLVLIETISGERVYGGPPMEAAVARLHCPPALPEGLPPGWQRLLRLMTAADPLDRPTAAEVADHLSSLPTPGAVLPPDPTESDPTEPAPTEPAPAVTQRAPMTRLGPRVLAAATLVLMLSLGAFLPHAAQGPAAVESQVPRVAQSLQVALDDLRAAVADLGNVAGVGAELNRVDHALVERRYPAAATHLRSLIAVVRAARDQGLVDQARAQSAVTAARRLLALLPIASTTTAPTAGPTASGTDAQRNPSPKAQPGERLREAGHDAKKPQNGHGKGHGR
jgi:hypothetical protein